jgi:hypothetical protein
MAWKVHRKTRPNTLVVQTLLPPPLYRELKHYMKTHDIAKEAAAVRQLLAIALGMPLDDTPYQRQHPPSAGHA